MFISGQKRILRKSHRIKSSPSLIILDSDGTVLDSMGLKHRRAFAPCFCDFFFVGAPKNIREELWYFINVKSTLRAKNRFIALSAALHLGCAHPLIGSFARGESRLAQHLDAWLALEASPSNDSLEKAIHSERANPTLQTIVEWSINVSQSIKRLPSVPAFIHAALALPMLKAMANVVVVSSAPRKSIEKDWYEAGIARHEIPILGQEDGSKQTCISALREKYPHVNSIIMLGDSLSDLEDARASSVQFFPICPAREEAAWKEFVTSYLEGFLRGRMSAPPIAAFLNSFRPYIEGSMLANADNAYEERIRTAI